MKITGESVNMNEPDELLTLDELCAFLKVPKSWVYSRTCKGEIPVVRLGGGRLLRFQKKAVMEALNIPACN